MDDLIRFSVSLPKELFEALNHRSKESSSRSEYIRDLIREKLVADEWSGNSDSVIGVLTIVYTHHQSDLVVQKLELEHHAHVDIVCTTHVHIDHHNCLETAIIKGRAEDINGFKDKISGLKGVKFADLSRVAVTM